MIALLSKVATIRMKLKFNDRHGGGDQKQLRIFNSKYNHEADRDNEDLKQFRQWHSKTPGHPEVVDTPGVETTTGPLGQGLANAVGIVAYEGIRQLR